MDIEPIDDDDEPQPFVLHIAHGIEQQSVGALQRLPGVVAPAVGRQRTRMPPPDVHADAEIGARQALRFVSA